MRMSPYADLLRRARRATHVCLGVLCLGVLYLGGLAVAPPARAQSRADFGAVWCYDQDRDAIARVLPASCQGRIIDDAEATRLGEARAERVKRLIGDAGPRATPGNPQPYSTLPGTPAGPRAPAPDGRGRSALPPRAIAPRQPDITVGRMPKSSGTGFFINETGAVLTNFHVVGSCGAVTVTGYDRTPIAARVSASAATVDLALLHASTVPPAVASFSKDPRRTPTDRAILVGFSLRGQPTTTATLTTGHAKQSDLATDQWRLAFDGKAYPGHSGSPLLNQFGEVVAVVHARGVERTAYAGGPIETKFGLAISLRATREFLDSNNVHVQTGKADRSFSDQQLLERARRFVVRVQCWS